MGIEVREVTSPEMLQKSAKVGGMLSADRKEMKFTKFTLYAVRYGIAKLYRATPKIKGTKFTRVTLGRTNAILAEPAGGSSNNNIIVYIHGGAFMSGRAKYSKGYASSLANSSECRVYAVDYSLSPEVKYPVAFNECLDAIENLKSSNPDSKITVIGDSAGGNLCLAVALKLKGTGKISCVILHSPVTDFSDTIDRAKYKKGGIVVKNGLKTSFRKLYFGDHDDRDPYISPYFGDYQGFPPTFITCDINESLYADAIDVYEKCEAAGTEVQMVAMEGAFHAFAVMGGATKETKDLQDDYIAFMKRVTA